MVTLPVVAEMVEENVAKKKLRIRSSEAAPNRSFQCGFVTVSLFIRY